jgi:hypothetical protein
MRGGEQLTLICRQSKTLNTKRRSNIVPRSTAVTIGNASGMVDPVCADGQLVRAGLERTTDESAVIPAIFK